jgi:hypothetical protein
MEWQRKGNEGKKVWQQTRKISYEGEDRVGAKEVYERR